MKQLFHQHLLIKAYVDNSPTDTREIELWLEDLVTKIGMKVVIPARAVNVSTPGNSGPTAQVGLETSHAALHIWNEQTPHMLQMDVYSCKAFNTDAVLEKIKEWDLITYESMTIDRNDYFVVTEKRVNHVGT